MSGRTTRVNHYLDLRAQRQSFSDLAAYFELCKSENDLTY